MRIAFAGNPNSGKTTMYNALTGRNEKVGNWAGVTVDKNEATVKKAYSGGEELIAVDLPGAYSMSPFTSEESVTSTYIQQEKPDVIINIVDGTNLSRSLFFTTQLLELGIPVVVALNKSDVNRKKETLINREKLSEALCCPVVETASTTAEGLSELIRCATEVVGKPQKAPYDPGEVDMTDKKAVVHADRKRYAFVNKLVSRVEIRKIHTRDYNIQDKADEILTNKWAGIPIFALVMFLVFKISQEWLGAWLAEGVEIAGVQIPGLVTLINMFGLWVNGLLEAAGASQLVTALVVDGMIGGVGAVIGFLPLVMVMYFLIALLEDCGYMARVAVVLDPIFKRVGLSGKSVIPFVITIGCAIPGVMAARTIRNERERKATAMLAPFMPCGAKLPVISLFAGAFFDNSAAVTYAMYLAGILLIFIGALLVNKITGVKGRKSFFIMELPEYKTPSLWGAFKTMCSRGWSYIVKAGTIILLCNTLVQLMQSFDWSFQVVAEGMEETSILATIAKPVAYLLVPVVGYHAWQVAAAAVTGFIAKENVVATLAVCYAFTVNEDLELVSSGEAAAAMVGMTKAAALAYMMFNLYSPPCFAAIGAMNAEMRDKKWLLGGIALQLGVGFTVGYLVYTVGTLLMEPQALNISGAVAGAAAIAAFAAVVCFLIARNRTMARQAAERK